MPDTTDIILPARVARAIEYYVDSRDPDKAALLANMEPLEFRRWMRKRQVKAIIDRKIDLVDQATAELRARARILTADRLDAGLLDVIEAKSAKVPAMAKVRAIELGYKRHGMLKEKVEHSGENGGPVTFQLVRIGAKKDGESE